MSTALLIHIIPASFGFSVDIESLWKRTEVEAPVLYSHYDIQYKLINLLPYPVLVKFHMPCDHVFFILNIY